MSQISFHYQVEKFRIKNSRILRKKLIEIFEVEKKEFDRVNFIFCTSAYILEINKKFLNHDFETDIITFNLGNERIIGEIYVCVEMVYANSKKFETSFINELNRVISHGIFHLCGYDDKNKKDKRIMRNKENSFLKLLN